MTGNLVSWPLAALLSPRTSESLLSFSASSQQKGKEHWGLEVAHLIPIHIPLARSRSRDHSKLQGRLGNVVCAWKMPLFCSPLGLDLALGRSCSQIHICLFKMVAIPPALSCLTGFGKVSRHNRLLEGPSGHCHYSPCYRSLAQCDTASLWQSCS